MASAAERFPGFRAARLPGADGVEIFARIGGSGPPLLILHGFPQTHAMRHRVAPALARRFTLVCADLRGHGASGRPAGDAAYAKRAMAADTVAAMAALGRHRFALDHAERLDRVAFLDITPSLHRSRAVDMAVATKAYHGFFPAQPGGPPERLVGAAPEFFSNPDALASACADYRANATLDLADDAADEAAGQRVTVPSLVLWEAARRAAASRCWRPGELSAQGITGRPVASGHFLAEEAPGPTANHLLACLAPE